jgi:hypothetical protein
MALATVVGLSHHTSAAQQSKNSKAHTSPCRIEPVVSSGKAMAKG